MITKAITISNSEKLGLISNLATMLIAGISLVEAVDSLLEDAKTNQKKLLESVRADLIQGNHLYTAFSKFPQVFDKVSINIIKASESAGTLDITLHDMKDAIKKNTEFTDKVRNALAYPVIILIAFCTVMLIILTFVVPRISQVFTQLKVQLPLPTKVIIFLSEFLLANTILIIILAALVGLGSFYLYKTKKQFFLQFFVSFPFISKVTQKVDITRFTRSLFLLLRAGIPIVTALELAQDVVVKKDVLKAIANAKEVISAGGKLSEGFKNSQKIFPSIMIKITEAGERSGTLEKSMQEISDYFEYEVSNELRHFLTLLEPIMLVFIGVFVGAIMLSIMAPIYGLISEVGSRR